MVDRSWRNFFSTDLPSRNFIQLSPIRTFSKPKVDLLYDHFKIEMMERAVRREKFSYADEAFAFIEELDRLTAPDAVMDAMQKSLSLFGFDNFIMTCLPGPREKFEQAVLMRKWPKGWFSYTRPRIT